MSKIYDANRLRKSYPLIRVKPVYKQYLDTDIADDLLGVDAEVAVVNFVDSYQKTYNFTKTYTEIPVIGLTPEEENVNVFITSLTTTGLVIESSNNFTGKVHVQVYDVS